jgi:hypothetical protein
MSSLRFLPCAWLAVAISLASCTSDDITAQRTTLPVQQPAQPPGAAPGTAQAQALSANLVVPYFQEGLARAAALPPISRRRAGGRP